MRREPAADRPRRRSQRDLLDCDYLRGRMEDAALIDIILAFAFGVICGCGLALSSLPPLGSAQQCGGGKEIKGAIRFMRLPARPPARAAAPGRAPVVRRSVGADVHCLHGGVCGCGRHGLGVAAMKMTEAETQNYDEGYSAFERGALVTDNPHCREIADHTEWLQGWREAAIYDQVQSCGGCGSREFPRRSDCESCTAVVDDDIAAALRSVNAEADRIAAITREIACS